MNQWPRIGCSVKLKKWAFILFLLAIQLPANADVFMPRNYSDENGLASSRVYYAFQDSKGYMWLATENGVNRFDGKDFSLFTTDEGLADNEVLKIQEDSRGRIWFLSLNGKLSYYKDGKFFNPSNSSLLRNAFSKGSFLNFLEDGRANLWFSTNQNALIRISVDNRVIYYTSKYKSLANCALREDNTGRILAINSHYAFQLKEHGLKPIRLKNYPTSARGFMESSPDGRILYMSKAGLSDLDGNILKDEPGLKDVKPELIMQDSKGNYWAATAGKGAYLYRRSGFGRGVYNLLNHTNVSHIAEDRQGNIWICTIGNGVFLLPFNYINALNIDSSEGLSSNSVTAIGRYGEQLLLGLRNGDVFAYSDGGNLSEVYHASSMNNSLRQITYDHRSGKLWYALEDRILSYRKDEHVHLEFAPRPDISIKSFSHGPHGELAIAHASGVLVINGDRRASNLNEHPAMHERSFTVFYDSRGRLWFSNVKGLHYVTEDSVQSLHQQGSVLKERITGITELPDGRIVCTTYGSGIFLLKDNKVLRRIVASDGLASNICKKIYSEDYKVWVATARGLSSIDFTNGDQTIQSFTVEDGLLSDEINDIFVEGDHVYIATDRGLTIFNAEKSMAKPAPSLHLLSVKVNKTRMSPDSLDNLSYARNMLTFDYMALDFAYPEHVSYRYRLHGQSRWVETQSNSLVFAALEPGDYRMEIMARSLYSDWGAPILVKFSIAPPFWERWWFIILEIAALGTFVYLVVRRYFRVRQHKEGERLKNQTKMLALEQQALQAMMNPHFIFNVMNSIQYFINTRDHTMANQVLTGFARLIRKNLEICTKSYISLDEELDYLNLYLRLEKMRFGEKLSYDIMVSADIDKANTMIPAMLLQPYVENAIWHGIMPKEVAGHIEIRIESMTGYLLIKIIDDGVGIENSVNNKAEHISRGMDLTKQRIALINKNQGTDMSVHAQQLSQGGTMVELKMPFLPFTN